MNAVEEAQALWKISKLLLTIIIGMLLGVMLVVVVAARVGVAVMPMESCEACGHVNGSENCGRNGSHG